MISETTPSLTRSIVRIAGVVVAFIVVTIATFGWLYWIRGSVAHWVGPKLHDALPLDELPGHDSLPIIAYVAVFAVSAAVLGVIARAGKFERAAAAVTIAIVVGGLCYFADVVSVFIARQISFDASLHDVASFQSVYLAAALGGLGGALLGQRPNHVHRQLTVFVVYATAIAGLLDLVSAIVPRTHAGATVVHTITSGLLPPLARTLVVPIGILLLIAARGLARRNRHACQVAIALLFVSSVLQLLRDLDYVVAIVSGLVAVLLVARRHDFTAKSDPTAHPRAFGRLSLMVVVAFVFGVLVRVVHLLSGDVVIHPATVLMASLKGLVGSGESVSGRPTTGYPWTSLSEVSIVLIGVVWAIGIWTAPWRHRLSGDERARRRALDIVRVFGIDTLAPFALRRDKELFFHSEGPSAPEGGGTAMLAYRVVRGIALVTGDPIGPASLIRPTLEAFLEYTHARGWRIAVIGASTRQLELYRGLGLHDLYHGDEAVIDVTTFSLGGGSRKSVRQAAHRVARKGYTSQVVTVGSVSTSLRNELATLDQTWLGNRARKGFVMELDNLFTLGGGDAIFVIGRDPEGKVAGFLHLAVCEASSVLSLSSMPRRSDAPNGFNAWLIVELTDWAKSQGYHAISLNFSPFAGLLEEDAELSSIQRVEREALLRVKGLLSLQLDNLHLFNRSFSPQFEARYCIFERRGDLPRVVIAAMAAENYIPFSERLRGWDEERALTGTTATTGAVRPTTP